LHGLVKILKHTTATASLFDCPTSVNTTLKTQLTVILASARESKHAKI